VIQRVERTLGQVWRLPSEQAVRDRVRALNDLLDEAGVGAHLDDQEVVSTWKRMARLRIGRL